MPKVNGFRLWPLPFETLLCFDLFLHVDKLLVCIVKLVLQKSQLLRRNDVQAKSVLQLPLPFQGYEPLIDKSGNVWMHVQIEFLYANLVNQSVYLTFQLVCKQDARLYFSLPKQVGQVSSTLTSIAGRTRCLVICISPNLLNGRMLWRARSFCMFLHILS